MSDERAELVLDLLEHARHLARLANADAFGTVPPRAAQAVRGVVPTRGPVPEAPPESASGPAAGAPREAGPTAAEFADLAAARLALGDCRRCGLAAGRKTIVYGQGNPAAQLMFVGEAPGADEDEQGLPFVGRAGQLLTDIIEKGLKLGRADVYIANVIKCRPPGNRNPETDEILSCQPFLEEQIRIIQPRVIVGLGKFAVQWLLKTAEPISKVRGRLGAYGGIHVVPTFHPAYLLRNPGAKRDVWEDMKLVIRLLGE